MQLQGQNFSPRSDIVYFFNVCLISLHFSIELKFDFTSLWWYDTIDLWCTGKVTAWYTTMRWFDFRYCLLFFDTLLKDWALAEKSICNFLSFVPIVENHQHKISNIVWWLNSPGLKVKYSPTRPLLGETDEGYFFAFLCYYHLCLSAFFLKSAFFSVFLCVWLAGSLLAVPSGWQDHFTPYPPHSQWQPSPGRHW